jgi:hypothetical protein
MRKIAVKLCLVFFALDPVSAEFVDGNKWLSWASGDTSEQLVASGYVAGVFDTSQKVRHCAPDEVTLGQAVAMSKKFITHNAEHRHISADQLIVKMLSQLFPCPKVGAHAI